MSLKKILIIDDDGDFTESTKIVLESQGYEIFSAKNRSDGWKKVSTTFPDLIILDVMMETMSDGFDLARQIKNDERYKKIPILMMTAIKEKTGYSFSDKGGDRQWLPVDEYLEKPIASEDLISRVRKLLPDEEG